MTLDQLRERWPIMQAFLDGKRVEKRVSSTCGEHWEIIDDAMDILMPEFEIRIVTEVRKPREIWINDYLLGGGCGVFYPSKEECRLAKKSNSIEQVKFREVIE